MKCIFCGGDTIVIDSRNAEDFMVKRRRECTFCKRRFSTSEAAIDKKNPDITKKKKKNNAYNDIKSIEDSYMDAGVIHEDKGW